MELMHNRIRPYAWGSRIAIAELLGEPSPSPHPQAELWIGAHPADSSLLIDESGERSLAELIAADPLGTLGRGSARGLRLAAAVPAQGAGRRRAAVAAGASVGRAGRSRVRAGGGGRAAAPISPQRNYRDSSHKPELICALTEFHALCGFREPATTVQLLAALGVPQLDHYLGLLSGQPDAHGIRALFSSIITIPPVTLGPLLSAVLSACVDRVRAGSEFTTEYRTALELGERYPGDPGVLASLLLNRHHPAARAGPLSARRQPARLPVRGRDRDHGELRQCVARRADAQARGCRRADEGAGFHARGRARSCAATRG